MCVCVCAMCLRAYVPVSLIVCAYLRACVCVLVCACVHACVLIKIKRVRQYTDMDMRRNLKVEGEISSD